MKPYFSSCYRVGVENLYEVMKEEKIPADDKLIEEVQYGNWCLSTMMFHNYGICQISSIFWLLLFLLLKQWKFSNCTAKFNILSMLIQPPL